MSIMEQGHLHGEVAGGILTIFIGPPIHAPTTAPWHPEDGEVYRHAVKRYVRII